jgi:hypothetical protein
MRNGGLKGWNKKGWMGQLRVTAKKRRTHHDSDQGAAEVHLREWSCRRRSESERGRVHKWKLETRCMASIWQTVLMVTPHTYHCLRSHGKLIDRSRPLFGGHLSRTVTDCHDAHGCKLDHVFTNRDSMTAEKGGCKWVPVCAI